jgi:hypothetical protein
MDFDQIFVRKFRSQVSKVYGGGEPPWSAAVGRPPWFMRTMLTRGGVELLIPLLKHTKYYYFCELSMCRPMPTQGINLKKLKCFYCASILVWLLRVVCL